jgi:hypothetical protein
VIAGDPAVLHANLAVIARKDPGLAAAIAATPAHPEVRCTVAPDGLVTGTVGGRSLASQRAPGDEANRLADTVPLETNGGIVVLGFGLGHHVAALAHRARTASALVIFEPDVSLMRAVLERVDHSGWLGETVWAIATDADDAVALSKSLKGLEAPLAVGTAILEHPPSRARLGDASSRFASVFARTFAAMRTHIITTMVQTDVTVRNESMNVAHYVRRPGIDELRGLADGRPAIVVSAGPSLRRNVALLRTPGLRDRCVIIAVQTVVKHLLAEGIRPHFVTAIDYHEISKRFYEGLTADMVEGVTLVVEPRANAAIVDAFPGDIRLPGDDFLDAVVGAEPGARARLTPAATVAHQAYYLARYLGADPVMVIGQDLAFTDGQYYAPGAAIHETWAPELNPFTSLERLEWERIARTRGTLMVAEDHLGRRVYTDEQMATYLAQFERDFADDAAKGLVTIDATEGGVRKAHATPMPLREALDRFAHAHVAPLPEIPRATARDGGGAGEASARERIRTIARDVRRIARDSETTIELLESLPGMAGDRARTNRTIDRINAIRDGVQGLDPAFGLVMRLNQTGAFKRFKADRLIRLAQSMSPQDVQRRQIERDTVNVRWIRDMATVLAELLEEGERTFDGGPKRTHDTTPPSLESAGDAPARQTTVGAVVVAPDAAAAERMFLGAPVVVRTIERLARCTGLRGITVVTPEPDRIARVVGPVAARCGVRVERMDAGGADRARSINAARAWSRWCWRGGIAGMTVFDEVMDPGVVGPVVERAGWDGAVVVGAEWCLVDPGLTDALVARFSESPEANHLTFCQAPPGLAPCVVSRAMMADFAQGSARQPVFATAGAALGYVPLRPRSDPIAKPACVQIDAQVRSTMARCIPDSMSARAELEAALGPHVDRMREMDATEIARIVRESRGLHCAAVAGSITIEVTTDRAWTRFPGIDPSAQWDRGTMDTDRAVRIVRALGGVFPGTPVTFGGFGDPLLHPEWPVIADAAREAGLGPVHVRTMLAGNVRHEARLTDGLVDAVSVDVLAHQAATFERLTGIDAYAEVVGRLDALLAARGPGMPRPWIVPRITRCDAVYDELEVFFDKWTIVAGAAAIDPVRRGIAGDRIDRLPVPGFATAAHARMDLCIRADGTVPVDARDPASAAFSMLAAHDPMETWHALASARHAAIATGDLTSPLLHTDW